MIAYDCLGFSDQCRQAIGSLFLNINEYDDDLPLDNDIQNKGSIEESKAALEFFENLVMIAPSSEVREILSSLINDMAEELLPAFQFAEPMPFDRGVLFNNFKDDYSIDLCKRKSFWKRLKNWCEAVCDWAQTVLRLLKEANAVKKAYDELHRKNEYNNSSHEQYRQYNNNRNFK